MDELKKAVRRISRISINAKGQLIIYFKPKTIPKNVDLLLRSATISITSKKEEIFRKELTLLIRPSLSSNMEKIVLQVSRAIPIRGAQPRHEGADVISGCFVQFFNGSNSIGKKIEIRTEEIQPKRKRGGQHGSKRSTYENVCGKHD